MHCQRGIHRFTSIGPVLLLLLITLLHGPPPTRAQKFYDNEKSLRTAVLTSYEYKIRPNITVTCTVRLSLLNINVLDVPSQSLSVSGWLTIKWEDERLMWTPATYGDIVDIYDTETVFWRPELIVDNSVSNIGVISNDKLLIRATHQGELIWEPPGIFETHCNVDVTFYPFDTQVCEIEVTSWAYTLNEVDLQATDADIYLAEFSMSGEWEILKTWSVRRELEVDSGDVHSQLDFFIQLRRRPSYYVMTILVPVIVTAVLCVLVFVLPADSGEKVGYTLTILLTYVVMLTLVAGYMPPTSKTTSVLSIYLTIILFVGVISTLITVVTLYFHHHPDTPVPPVLHSVFLNFVVPAIRWKKRRETSDGGNEIDGRNSQKQNNGGNGNATNKAGRFTKVHPHDSGLVGRDGEKTEAELHQSKHSKGGDVTEDQELSWQDLALLLDAFSFRVMGIFVLLLTILVILTLLIGGYS